MAGQLIDFDGTLFRSAVRALAHPIAHPKPALLAFVVALGFAQMAFADTVYVQHNLVFDPAATNFTADHPDEHRLLSNVGFWSVNPPGRPSACPTPTPRRKSFGWLGFRMFAAKASGFF